MNDAAAPPHASQQHATTPEAHPIAPNRRTFLAGSAAVAGAAALTGAAVAAGGADAAPAKGHYPLPVGRDRLRVFLNGDAGTGKQPQYAVTAAARKIHARAPFDLAVSLGDNIYESGPDGPDDDQFRTKFEKPNAGLDFPWLMTLGNHDNSSVFPGDGGWLLRGDAEVAYHRRSKRWYMPKRYYSVSTGVADFFVLDLNPLAAYVPPFLSPEWEPGGRYMTQQARWLERSLAASKAPWTFVCTHHPYLNNGPHGAAGDYDGLPAPLNGVELKKFVERHVAGKANFLLSGHDHSQQVFDSAPALKGTRQIISGAAAKSVNGESKKRFRARYENFADRGFMVLDITPSQVALDVHAVKTGKPGSVVEFSNLYRR
ncbi:MAG: metallophosphoesterase [Gordonia sp. (in: high G+C Gram-positive bacteria)]|uniref:metallophosphoesterase n=1 Tax=Gordonia sp. (in: high G+C Gram-positive bacteria) TaxID=84139 RepID=UPI0039E31962